MKGELHEKAMGAIKSVLPITALVLMVDIALAVNTGASMPHETLMKFIVGAVLLVIGLTLVELGADMSLIPMGDGMGAYLTKTAKLPLLIVCCFLIGTLVTMAEPDLAVLAAQFPAVSDLKMILIIASGVGVLLVFGVIRVIRRIPLALMLPVFYALIFILAVFEPGSFFAVAFDSGGVATGPIVVPFIMAVGLGLAAVRGTRRGGDDGFGMVGICVLGPVIAMLTFGIFGKYDLSGAEAVSPHGAGVVHEFLTAIPHYLKEVAIALLPIIAFFLIFQFVFLRLGFNRLRRIGVGLIYTFIGHVIFLTGVNIGFLPAGEYLGAALIGLPGELYLLIVPVGMLMGNLAVLAEPAVILMNERIDEVTVGAVSRRAMLISLSIGVAVSSGVAMVRVITGLPLWWFLLGGYALSLILSAFVPSLFTAIAFDSGGVVSGAMTISFLLPFVKGACMAFNGSAESVLTDAFGSVALVAIAPVISIQLLGLIYSLRLKRAEISVLSGSPEVRIIEFDTEGA